MRGGYRSGFTLVEIMIVVLIRGLLALMAIPHYVRSRRETWRAVCVNNLRLIADAKELWAFGGGTGIPTPDDLHPYIQSFPKCAAGDEPYTPGPIGELPVCPNAEAYPEHCLER